MKLEKIYDGDDRAAEMGEPDFDALIRAFTEKQVRAVENNLHMASAKKRDALAKIPHWNGQVDAETAPLKAYINGGRWLVRCDCGGVEMPSRSRGYVFCHECGNDGKGSARRVDFPKDLKKVEAAVLKNAPAIEQGDMNSQRAAMLFPTVRWEA